ncbi:MAG: hypothetical protein FJ138_02145 [Deltaproteobacteria bacterium]|nr:hypothetical protein [Deltaproteobacteria bacterium]
MGAGVADLGGLWALALLSLPLSAPLYLHVSAWGRGEGLAAGRAFTVGLRWTGERDAPELDPPAPGAGAGGAPGEAPAGGALLPSSAPPPAVAPRAPGGGLSPLSPGAPGGGPRAL